MRTREALSKAVLAFPGPRCAANAFCSLLQDRPPALADSGAISLCRRETPASPRFPGRTHSGCRHDLPVIAALATGLAFIPAAAADQAVAEGHWDFTPRVGASLELTDNVTLAPRGDEEHDLIGTVFPGFSVSRRGARSSADVTYSLRQRFHARESREDRLTHRLSGRGEAELVHDALFIEASASRAEYADSLLGPVGIDDSTPRANLRETTRYRISPYLLTRYGAFAHQEVRYTFSETLNHRSQTGDSSLQRIAWTLDSGPAFNRPFWQLAGHYEEERFDDLDTGEFAQASATVGYRFGRSLRVFAVGGREYNDYQTAREDVDGSFWEVGAGWNPTPVTRIDARYGERYFGKTGSLAIDHRSRRATYHLSYSESIDSTRSRGPRFDELASLLGVTVDDLFTLSPNDLALLFALSGLEDDALVEGYYLSRRLRASWRYDTGRSVYGITAFRTERESESPFLAGVTPDDRTSRGVNLSWDWRLGARTDTRLSTGLVRHDYDFGRTDDLWNLRAGITRQMTPDLSGSLTYRYQQRDSDLASDEYRENAFIATVTTTF